MAWPSLCVYVRIVGTTALLRIGGMRALSSLIPFWRGQACWLASSPRSNPFHSMDDREQRLHVCSLSLCCIVLYCRHAVQCRDGPVGLCCSLPCFLSFVLWSIAAGNALLAYVSQAAACVPLEQSIYVMNNVDNSKPTSTVHLSDCCRFFSSIN
jgi:hypothetical protein